MVLRGRKGAPLLALFDRYLACIAVPLIGTLVLAAMLLVLEKMLRLFDFVITAGGQSA
jgi:lipopolysaccharide export system permease protein